MKLVSVKEIIGSAEVLYELLKVRAPEENISHRKIPTWWEHIDFVVSDPYDAWYLIEKDLGYIGAIYIVRGEIGVHLFPQYRHHYGHEVEAIKMVMGKHPLERYFMNISTKNPQLAGKALHLGGKIIQLTYEIENERA